MSPAIPSNAGDDRSRVSTQAVLDRFGELCGPLGNDGVDLLLPRQCEAAVRVLAVDAVGISLLLEGMMRMPLGASSADATTAERLQFTLGEGPCLDAYSVKRPVLVPDVADQGSHAWRAWPEYAEELLARTPFRAVFAIPLTSSNMTIGTLSMYRVHPGPLSPVDLGHAVAVTNQIFDHLLETGTFSGHADVSRWLDLPVAQKRTAVWQAIGMATVELGLNPADTLALLRSYSYGNGLLLDDVAADIVSGKIAVERLQP